MNNNQETQEIEHVSRAATAPLANHAPAVAHYADASRAESTKRAYRADWQQFAAWCDAQQLASLPAAPATVAAYLAALADGTHCQHTASSDADLFKRQPLKVATITRKMASISQAHQLAGFEPPTRSEQVRTVLKGIKRVHGTAQNAKAPATTDVVRLLLEQLPHAGLTSMRDRALLLVGFAGAFRRAELVSLDVADLKFERAGLRITLRHSKTDQEGAGMIKALPYGLIPATCPVRALEQWLASANITSGPIFRGIDRHGNIKRQRMTAQSVALVVKKYAQAAGLDVRQFSGHSLRAGLATSAAAAGVEERKIMQQTGHRSSQMVRKYIRDAELFKGNAAGSVGL